MRALRSVLSLTASEACLRKSLLCSPSLHRLQSRRGTGAKACPGSWSGREKEKDRALFTLTLPLVLSVELHRCLRSLI